MAGNLDAVVAGAVWPLLAARPGARFEISFNEQQLRDPESLIATAAHELGHVHLLGDRRISPRNEDHEPLTDLLTVFMGLGVFTANAAKQFRQYQSGFLQGWSGSNAGYLSQAQFGYALALFAWLRDESNPDWSKSLTANVRSHFKKSLKYLAASQEALLLGLKGWVSGGEGVLRFPER